MELSGLIFVALALVWAVVLIPKALKHHDELAETRSVDSVSDDARVLARREAVSERQARLVVGPAVSTVIERPATQARSDAPTATARAEAPVPRVPSDRARRIADAHRKAAKTAARRRRHVLGFLLLATLAVTLGTLTGVLLTWAPGIPAGVMVAYLALARFLVRREHARWDRVVRDLRRTPARPVRAEEAPVTPVATAPEVREERRNEQGLAVVSGLDDTSSFPMGLLAEAAPDDDRGSLWDPLPVTLPTYVSKPRATRSVRTIDLNAPGVSSSGRDAAASALVAEAATAAAPEGPGQRAVGH